MLSLMESKVVSFRCPWELLECIDQLVKKNNSSRSAFILSAIERMNTQVLCRGGRVVPPYKTDSISLPFICRENSIRFS